MVVLAGGLGEGVVLFAGGVVSLLGGVGGVVSLPGGVTGGVVALVVLFSVVLF